MSEAIVVVLELAKETKGTYRFDASDAGPRAPITSLYIQKTAFAGATVPKHVHVTVEAVD